jgi:hypothetical protein
MYLIRVDFGSIQNSVGGNYAEFGNNGRKLCGVSDGAGEMKPDR